jgi:hypothetical protein
MIGCRQIIVVCLIAFSAPGFASDGDGELNFRTRILPILTKAGCNAGACHGAASGQGGLRLSLLGYDPEEDYWTITREFAGRRIDLDSAKESLFLKKPARQLEHEGGRKLPRDSAGYETLVRWIEAGVPFGAPELRVTEIVVEPSDRLLPRVGEQIQLEVTAKLSDGTERNVTELALFSSNDDGIAEVNRTGRVTTRNRGLTSIMVRLSGQVAAARIAVPFGEAVVSADEFAPHNFIDREILAQLQDLGLPPSPLGTDAEFLRRVTLDLTGRLPEAAEARRWLRAPDRREQLVRSLLATEAFVDFWTLKFADLLLISGKRGSEKAAATYHHWLREQIAKNTSWDAVARSLVGAEGDVTETGPANFLTLATDPRDLSEYASSMLLGTQIACARCHAHPSDRWTQTEYYQFAAFFARVSREGNVIGENPRRELEHPKTKQPVQPKALGFQSCIPADADRTEELARWMTAPENPFFARAMVNRVWKHLLGRGLVEPVDDLRPTNPASHPKLLDRLAEHFVANGFDLRHLIETIVSSRTYQLSSITLAGNRADNRFFSHAYFKPLPAQVLVDAISQVTGVNEEFETVAEGTRAVQLIGAQTPSYALDVLGRCKREQACEPAGSGGGLAQALHMINGATINEKLGSGVLARWLREGKSNGEIIDELYLRAFSRLPREAEAKFWNGTLAKIGNQTEALEDFLWTVLNAREFAYNH